MIWCGMRGLMGGIRGCIAGCCGIVAGRVAMLGKRMSIRALFRKMMDQRMGWDLELSAHIRRDEDLGRDEGVGFAHVIGLMSVGD